MSIDKLMLLAIVVLSIIALGLKCYSEKLQEWLEHREDDEDGM